MSSSLSWKIVLGISIIVLVASIATFPSLTENISGDGVPNRPQREPPIEYQWNSVITRIVLIVLSFGVAVYSYNQTRNR